MTDIVNPKIIKTHNNLCAAIKSLNSENKVAFAPILTAEDHKFMKEAEVTRYGNFIKELSDYGDADSHLKEICYDRNPTLCDKAGAVASLITRINNQVIEQVNECYGYNASFSKRVRVHNECEDHYELHRDPGEGIRISLALKGKGTAFIDDQISSSIKEMPALNRVAYKGDIVNTPDLHLAVFTIGAMGHVDERYGYGAIHSPPKYDHLEGDCSRVLLLMGTEAPKMDAMYTE